MTVILKDIVPPIMEVSKLGYAAVAVYSLLFQSAFQDRRYGRGEYKYRRDCGGTTSWSHKAIAGCLGMGKKMVLDSVDVLLDNGFIQLVGLIPSSKGSMHRVYRVTHPLMLETVRAVIPMMPYKPSVAAKRLAKGGGSCSEKLAFDDENEFEVF